MSYFIQKKILKAQCFNEARLIFDEYIFQNPPKKEILQVLKVLQCKVENAYDVTVVNDFYKSLGEVEELLKFLRDCAFQEDKIVKNLRISIEKKLNNYDVALELCDNLNENDNISLTQKASMLNKIGDFEKARDIIELVLIKDMSSYSIKTYASIISQITKYDGYAHELSIPSLAIDICKNDDVNTFTVKNFFKSIIKYENKLGNKVKVNVTEKILKYYRHYIGEKY